MRIYTIGHSTRAIDTLIEILKGYDIEILADVRSWPSSRRNPQFNRDDLKNSLGCAGIEYAWLGRSLGGFRPGDLGADSPNTAWRNKSFKNYADHAVTGDFKSGLEDLIKLGERGRIAVMCAEKYYWRCHRRIISDHLTVRGFNVIHIVDKNEEEEHKLTRFAIFKEGVLTYPIKKNGFHKTFIKHL